MNRPWKLPSQYDTRFTNMDNLSPEKSNGQGVHKPGCNQDSAVLQKYALSSLSLVSALSKIHKIHDTYPQPQQQQPLTPMGSLSVRKANPGEESAPLKWRVPEQPAQGHDISRPVYCEPPWRCSRLKRQQAHPRSNLLTIMLLGKLYNLYLYLHMPAVNTK